MWSVTCPCQGPFIYPQIIYCLLSSCDTQAHNKHLFPFGAHLLPDSIAEPADNGICFLSPPHNSPIFGKIRGQSKWAIEKVKLQSMSLLNGSVIDQQEAPSVWPDTQTLSAAYAGSEVCVLYTQNKSCP